MLRDFNLKEQLLHLECASYELLDFKKTLLLLLLAGVFNFAVTAQSQTIKGTVKDSKGDAIQGVSVVIKNSAIGASTNSNGQYSIQAKSANDILVFTSIGFEAQEFNAGTNTLINVTLHPAASTGDEVIVVGYGTQSRRNVTGAISKADLSRTENLPNTNISQALRGSVAGVMVTDNGRPGQNGSILIRGRRSLSASNDPLVVLDGIIFSGSLADINPNDIQSLEVLKDASAASIYGSRAANGVILVTSKKGITEKPNIRFNTFKGISDWAYKVKMFDPERYLQSKLDWRAQSGLEADPSKILSYLFKSEADNYSNGVRHNTWDQASQKGRISSYDLSISGRSKSANYYLSGSFVDEKGLIFNDNQKRISLRANMDNQITDWLTVGMNATFINRDLSGLSADLEAAYYGSPYGTWYYPDGEPTQFVVPEDQVSSNSMYRAKLTNNQEIFQNLFSNFYAKINIPFIKGLDYRINYSPNLRWGHNYNFFRQDAHLPNNTMNASKFDEKNFDWVLENIVTYNKKIGKDHVLDLTLLYGRNHYGYEATTSTANQLSSGANGFNNLGLGNVLTNSSTANASEGVSSMFRLNYRFKQKYILTLTARRDGSSVFAVNNKYATFPSGAFAWIVSDEPFIRKVDFIDMLKFRISYGEVGNQAIGSYQSLSLSGTRQYVYGDGGSTTLGVFPLTMANGKLKWETTRTSNVAVDFDLFQRRLSGTIELYNNNTSNLLVTRSIPVMTGYTSIFANIGKVNNKGIELSLTSVNIQSDKFEWGTNVVFSSNKNKIVHLYNTDTDGDGKEDNDLSNNWFIGQPITTYFDYVFDGIYQAGEQIPTGAKPGDVRLQDLNKDGKINVDDRTIIGSGGQPKYGFGITNNFRYRNFSLSIFINSMQGWISNFPLLNTVTSPNAPGRGLNQLDAGYWTEENKSATRPSLVYSNPLRHGWYIDRNFVRIQDVSLSYQFSKDILSKLKMSALRLFLSGKNLHTFTKWPGSDPEIGGITSSSFYPMPRIITLGLNVGF